MFERLQKPFLTVETGEAFQPIRLAYKIHQKEKLNDLLGQLKCLENKGTGQWHWFWKDECASLHFESLESFKKNSQNALRLGSLIIKNDHLYINLNSFKRACLTVPFFHELWNKDIITLDKADFINRVFGLSDRLPHGFVELFDEAELEKLLQQRLHDYEEVQTKIENAPSAEAALMMLATYTQTETEKRLPYAERYSFEQLQKADPEIAFLSFYIYLRSRELVAIRRWFGETEFTLSDVAEETIEQVFGNMNIDIIE